ncbi:MAG: 5'/3'-nucleotidase SurE [Polyangiaceae bacterium]
MSRPLILLSNDDGYLAPGIGALRTALSRFADVVLCAPAVNQSASSHSLTLHSVLRLRRIDDHTFALDGTPADSVYVALHSGNRLLPRRPDLVVSGMNHGPNLGVDVVYSGTVAAAREGANRGIPAVAVSADNHADRAAAAALGAEVAERLWHQISSRSRIGPAPLLNVNVPAGSSWTLRPTRLGRRLYDDDVIYRHDPRGREYLWIGGSEVEHDLTEGTDTHAWEQGEASVTPLTLALDDEAGADLCRTIAG